MLEILEDYVKRGLLRKAEDENLVQYNYSEKCNNEGLWDDITLFNRGNIYEKSTGRLIAKAMPKFFNFSQLSETDQKHFLRTEKFINTEKKDGCLGILYLYNGEIRCNSRGGFNNYVTDVMKRLLPKYIMLKRILEHNTLNVEVISPETKIICDYGNEEELYLLTAFNKEGEELPIESLDIMSQVIKMPRPAYNNMSWTQLFEWQKSATYETEGFVVQLNNKKFGAYERVKIKSEDYLKIAKYKAGLNRHSIWKLWKIDIEQNTDFLTEYINALPDELVKVAKGYLDDLKRDLENQHTFALIEFEALKNIETRDLKAYFDKNPSKYQSIIYSLRNGKSIAKSLIKLIEPELIYDDIVVRMKEG